MIKKLFALSLISLIIVACGSNQKNEQQTQDETNVIEEPVVVTIEDFDKQVAELVSKKIKVEGTVDHVCHHGGKRMFLVKENTDGRVKVVTGEEMPAFNIDLEGKDVVVIGIVDELIIDENYLSEWEKELMMKADEEFAEGEGVGHGDGTGHDGTKMGEEADQGTHIPGMEQIEKYREMIAESGKDKLSFYSVICEKYEVKEENTVE